MLVFVEAEAYFRKLSAIACDTHTPKMGQSIVDLWHIYSDYGTSSIFSNFPFWIGRNNILMNLSLNFIHLQILKGNKNTVALQSNHYNNLSLFRLNFEFILLVFYVINHNVLWKIYIFL